MALGPALCEVLEALHLDAEQRAIDDRQRIAEARSPAWCGDMATATSRLATPSSRNSAGVDMPAICSSATISALAGHEGGVEHVDAGDHARAAVGAGPGLHRGEGRHDEQAAGDGEAGEIDRDANAAAGGEHGGDAGRLRRRRHAVGRPAEIEREKAEQHGADQRRQAE